MKPSKSRIIIPLFGLMGLFAAGVVSPATHVEEHPLGESLRHESAPPRNHVNLRLGAAASGAENRRPEICLEGSPWDWLSLEACGTGSGFLHHDGTPELAHFRSRLLLGSTRTSIGWVQTHALVGFAELQVGVDDPGFDFFGTGSSRNETAGLEAGAGVRLIRAITRDTELIADLNISAAWLPHAPGLSRAAPDLYPSAAFSVGVGF